MRRTVTRLADGRELIYFDEGSPAVRGRPDRRELPPAPPASQLRYDPLTDQWIAVAGHRQTRTFLPPPDECPLCPSTVDRQTEIPDPDYDVAVFQNRFPAFGGPPPKLTDLPEPYAARTAAGRCEVVCYTAQHDGSFSGLSPERVRTVLAALADRTRELGALPEVEEVFCFENRGVEIGVTLHHPHGQIYAYPFVAPRTRTMLAAARRHADATGGRNLFADVLAAERAAGTRVVAANDTWTAFVPAAARWPFEVIVAPNTHRSDLTELSDVDSAGFAPLYLDVLRRLESLFDTPVPYISAWRQAPVRADRELTYLQLHLFSIRRAEGKLKYLAGSESAMGVWVNDVVPEEAARMLREAL